MLVTPSPPLFVDWLQTVGGAVVVVVGGSVVVVVAGGSVVVGEVVVVGGQSAASTGSLIAEEPKVNATAARITATVRETRPLANKTADSPIATKARPTTNRGTPPLPVAGKVHSMSNSRP